MNKNIKKNALNDNVSILPNIEYSVITKEIRDKIGSLPLGIMGKEGARCFCINNHKFAKEVTESLYNGIFDFSDTSGTEKSLNINMNDFAYAREIYASLSNDNNVAQSRDFENTYLVLKDCLDNKLEQRGVIDLKPSLYDIYRRDVKHKNFREWHAKEKVVPVLMNTLDKDYSFKISKSYVDNSNNLTKSHVRVDECKVSYSTENLKDDVMNSVIKYYNNDYRLLRGNDELVNEIISEIEFEDGDDAIVSDIVNFIENQRKGCIPRAISYLYLKYVLNNIDSNKLSVQDKIAFESFKRYVSIFDIFENVLREMAFDSHDYSINCGSRETFDLVSELKKSDALKCLPIIGNINDSLPSTNKDKDNIIDISNVNLKLNGKVENHVITGYPNGFNSSLEYHKSYIRAVAEKKEIDNVRNKPLEIHERDILRKAITEAIILKSFIKNIVFPYNNISEIIKAEIKSAASRCTSPNSSRLWLIEFSNDFDKWYKEGNNEITGYKNLLIKWTKGVISKDVFENATYSKSFNITSMFLPTEPKEVLICKKTNISPTHKVKHTFLSDKDEDFDGIKIILKQDFVFEFSTKTILTSNVDSQGTWNVCDNKYMHFNIVLAPESIGNSANALKSMGNISFNDHLLLIYNSSDEYFKKRDPFGTIIVDDNKRFLYEIVYMIVTSMIYVYFAKRLNENKIDGYKCVSLNQIRFAINRKDNPISSNFCRTFTKEMDMSTLSNFASVCSQGFELEVNSNYIARHKVNNAMMSLYSEFDKDLAMQSAPNIEYSAIVAVTSITTDKSNTTENSDEDMSTVIIKVTEVYSKNGKVKIGNVMKHTYREQKKQLYVKSKMLEDIILSLKGRGCKNIIYIAKAPNVKKLETKGLDKKELYFFNEELMLNLQSSTGVNICPLYYTINNVSDCRENTTEQEDTPSFYCEFDIDDNAIGIVPVCGIYSGISSVNKKGSYYKTLISYATIKDMYKNDALNKSIKDIIQNKSNKDDIAKILYLYHMFAQEKAPMWNNKIVNVKSNPFAKLFGDDGIGAISTSVYNLSTKPNSSIRKSIVHNGFTLADYVVKQAINTYKK